MPIDDFGFNGFGSWFLGENGDNFWLEAIPDLVRTHYQGRDICFMGSSMGGYAALLHGIRMNASVVYANIAQTRLLGSTYANQGMAKFFEPIFRDGVPNKFNDLRNLVSHEIKTSFLLTGQRWDKPNYLTEQTFAFVQKLTECDVPFSLEIFPSGGHTLSIPLAEAADKVASTLSSISQPSPGEAHYVAD